MAAKEIGSIGRDLNGNTKVRYKRSDEWTTDRRARFLAHLAATCNVSESAKAVGINNASVYGLRRRDPDFAAAWAEAIEVGYSRIEMMLIERAQGEAKRVADAADALPETDATKMDTGLALELLRVHGAVARGGSGRRIGGRVHVPDRDAVAAKILAKIAADRRVRRGKSAGGKAAGGKTAGGKTAGAKTAGAKVSGPKRAGATAAGAK